MIICAALKVQIEGLPYTTVIPCWRHSNGYEILRDLGHQNHKTYKVEAEGFINHKNEFLDRVEGLTHAKDCGQLSKSNQWYKIDNKENELYSEDLY